MTLRSSINTALIHSMRSYSPISQNVEVGAQLEYLRTLNNLSPIYALPSELLSRIFELGHEVELDELADPDKITSELASTQCKPFEILLTHVSSHLRDIALRTPLLWSFVTITPYLPMPEELGAYLIRSDNCGLDVRLELSGVYILDALTMEKVDMVVSQSHRYHKLAINSFCELPAQPIIRRFCHKTTPILEHLSIAVNEAENFKGTSADKILQGGAPNLGFVRLRGMALHLFRPPLDSVTTLHLDQTVALPILYTTFKAMLTTSSSTLMNLSVYGDIIAPAQYGPAFWPGINDPIHLPYLRRLRICGVSGAIYSGLLLGITAPALEALILKDLKECDLARFCISQDNTLRFPCLYSLTFLDSEISRDAHIELFRAFPNIVTFTDAHQTSAPTIMLPLSESHLEFVDAPWPNLHTLSLVVDLYDADLIVDVIRHRRAVGFPLTKLRLGIPQPLSSLSQYHWLQANVIVENFVVFDGWPQSNSSYRADPDDTLFI